MYWKWNRLLSLFHLFSLIDGYLEIVVDFVEGLTLLIFFAIIVSQGWVKCNVMEVFSSTKVRAHGCNIDLMKLHKNKDTLLATMALKVGQLMLTKPLLTVIAVVVKDNGGSKVIIIVAHILSFVVTVLAVYTCLTSVLVLEVRTNRW